MHWKAIVTGAMDGVLESEYGIRPIIKLSPVRIFVIGRMLNVRARVSVHLNAWEVLEVARFSRNDSTVRFITRPWRRRCSRAY